MASSDTNIFLLKCCILNFFKLLWEFNWTVGMVASRKPCGLDSWGISLCINRRIYIIVKRESETWRTNVGKATSGFKSSRTPRRHHGKNHLTCNKKSFPSFHYWLYSRALRQMYSFIRLFWNYFFPSWLCYSCRPQYEWIEFLFSSISLLVLLHIRLSAYSKGIFRHNSIMNDIQTSSYWSV